MEHISRYETAWKSAYNNTKQLITTKQIGEKGPL